LYTDRAISRRELLKGTGKAALLGGAVGLGLLGQEVRQAAATAPATTTQLTGVDPLVWVWKFSADGPLGEIRDTLTNSGLHVILKTHDGTNWMERNDDSPDAVTGPGQVANLANTFEQAGIPFHAWCVVQGHDPLREAQMCAEVLQSGARDLYLDLEPPEGGNYWQGTSSDALAFGAELRRLMPNAWLVVAPDSRPWQAGSVPLAEFMSFSNAVAPQSYWETFQGPTNRRRYAEHGYNVGPEGVTPELVIEANIGTFSGFGRPIYPIGQGDSSPEKWRRFVASAMSHGIGSVSLWRYGVSDRAAFDVLRESLPKPVADAPTAPQEAAVAQAPAVEQPPEVIQVPEAAVPSVETAAAQPPMEAPAAQAPAVTSSHMPPAPGGQQPEPAGSAETPAGPPAITTDAGLPLASRETNLLRIRQTIDDMKARVISGLARDFLSFFR
jgi:hypothetical protein